MSVSPASSTPSVWVPTPARRLSTLARYKWATVARQVRSAAVRFRHQRRKHSCRAAPSHGTLGVLNAFRHQRRKHSSCSKSLLPNRLARPDSSTLSVAAVKDDKAAQTGLAPCCNKRPNRRHCPRIRRLQQTIKHLRTTFLVVFMVAGKSLRCLMACCGCTMPWSMNCRAV